MGNTGSWRSRLEIKAKPKTVSDNTAYAGLFFRDFLNQTPGATGTGWTLSLISFPLARLL